MTAKITLPAVLIALGLSSGNAQANDGIINKAINEFFNSQNIEDTLLNFDVLSGSASADEDVMRCAHKLLDHYMEGIRKMDPELADLEIRDIRVYMPNHILNGFNATDALELGRRTDYAKAIEEILSHMPNSAYLKNPSQFDSDKIDPSKSYVVVRAETESGHATIFLKLSEVLAGFSRMANEGDGPVNQRTFVQNTFAGGSALGIADNDGDGMPEYMVFSSGNKQYIMFFEKSKMSDAFVHVVGKNSQLADSQLQISNQASQSELNRGLFYSEGTTAYEIINQNAGNLTIKSIAPQMKVNATKFNRDVQEIFNDKYRPRRPVVKAHNPGHDIHYQRR